MNTIPTAGLTASQPPVSGRVAGAVLAAVRGHRELTQHDLAEAMQVSLATVQGWESGRRPLINLTMVRLAKLRRVLQLAAADSTHLAVLNEALQADNILSEIDIVSPAEHPLALIVPNRMLIELLAWPMTGRPPRQLAATRARLDVAPAERDYIAGALRTVADAAERNVSGAMLRRQAQYLVAEHPQSADWNSERSAIDARAAHDLREWSPDWAVARSRAISAASNGNPEPLQRFIEHGLSTDRAISANLAYWAYWVGEVPQPWSSDADMLTDTQPWSGELLLSSLLDGLENAPYRDLCADALHALMRHRRGLRTSMNSQRIRHAIDRATSTSEFRRRSVRKLEQLSYALEE